MAIFRVQSGKNYTGQKIFTQTPSVVSVTNIRYGAHQHPGVQWLNTSPEETHEIPVHEFNDKWTGTLL